MKSCLTEHVKGTLMCYVPWTLSQTSLKKNLIEYSRINRMVSTISLWSISDQLFSHNKALAMLQYTRVFRPRWLSWMHRPTGDQEVTGSTPAEVGNILFMEIDHELFSTVILSLPLIQEGQLSVSGERMRTILVNHLED